MKYDSKNLETKMQKTIAAYEANLADVRASQANAAILNRVSFEYYGAPTPINTMADIRLADSRTLVITPYDRSTLKAMVKAILASDIGITPADDGSVIRLIFPQLTEEHRKALAKQIVKMAEDARVAIRNIRRDAIEKYKDMKKKSELTEDLYAECEEEMQKLTDQRCKEIDKLTEEKEKELMAV